MHSNKNKFLITGSICSLIAMLAHVGCIIFGGDWYRFFGAGEQMAVLSEQGHWYPTVITSGLVLILFIWSLYGLSGAKVIIRMPLLRLGLVVISLIYLLRAIAFIFLMPLFPENSILFWSVSSGVCLFIGGLYSIGTYQNWLKIIS